MQTNLKLKSLNEQIVERRSYLVIIERDIEAVTLAASNQLLILKGEIGLLEEQKAELMRQNLLLEQQIRENMLTVQELVLLQ